MMAASFICRSLVYSFCSGSHTYLRMHREVLGHGRFPVTPPALFRSPVHCNYVQFYISFVSLSSWKIISYVLVCLSEIGGSKEHTHIFGCLSECCAIPKATGRAQTLEEGQGDSETTSQAAQRGMSGGARRGTPSSSSAAHSLWFLKAQGVHQMNNISMF